MVERIHLPAEIELPGFETVFPNEVYARKNEYQPSVEIGVQNIDLLLIGRFKTCTDYDIHSHLQQTAQGLTSVLGKEIEKGWEIGKTPLQVGLMALPKLVLKEIQERDLIYLKVESESVAPLHYLSIKYGVLDSNLLADNGRKGNIKDSRWYYQAFKEPELTADSYGEWFTMDMLLKNGKLPHKTLLHMLIKNKVCNSETLKVMDANGSGIVENYPAKYLIEVADALHSACPTPEEALFFPDQSAVVLENVALEVINQMLSSSETYEYTEESAMDEEAWRQTISDNGKPYSKKPN